MGMRMVGKGSGVPNVGGEQAQGGIENWAR